MTRFGSVCSGIEAVSVAWKPLGWEADFYAEIEPFPAAVIAHHHPEAPNLGDMTKFKDWPDAALDVLVGGTPCQSFSVAGLRKGLADPRGNLALVYLAIADRYRPRWLVWENVSGVLSSSGGRDFGAFLGGLGQLGYGWAYRVLDAQHFGVAQRRRRVFVVGYFGDWRRAAAVLFERESLSGHPPPRRKAGKAAPTIPSRGSAGGGLGTDFDCDGGLIAHALRAQPNASHRSDIAPPLSADADKGDQDTLIAFHPGNLRRGWGASPSEDVFPTLKADNGRSDQSPCIAFAQNTRDEVREIGGNIAGALPAQPGMKQQTYVAFNITPSNSNKDYNARPSERSQAITGNGNRPSARGGDIIAFTEQSMRDDGSVPTLVSGENGGGKNAINMPHVVVGVDVYNGIVTGEVAATLGANSGQSANRAGPTVITSAVRRLTPRECERLQGFPDDYTAIQHRGKPAADGNSMAVPVMAWIGKRIQMVEELVDLRRGKKGRGK